MLDNLKQPARQWLADVIENFGHQLDAEEDPSVRLSFHGAELEVRLVSLEGVFERETVNLDPNQSIDGDEDESEDTS